MDTAQEVHLKFAHDYPWRRERNGDDTGWEYYPDVEVAADNKPYVLVYDGSDWHHAYLFYPGGHEEASTFGSLLEAVAHVETFLGDVP